MRWQLSLLATAVTWALFVLVYVIAAAIAPLVIIGLVLVPVVAGLLAGLMRPRVPGFPLLLAISLLGFTFATIAMLSVWTAQCPRCSGPTGEEFTRESVRAIYGFVVGAVTVAALGLMALGALLVARFEQLRSQ